MLRPGRAVLLESDEMNKQLRLLALAVFSSFAALHTAGAASIVYDFAVDPIGSLIYSGNVLWNYSGGNPATGGYVSLTEATTDQRSAILLPDLDNGQPVKSFSFSMDARVGDGSPEPGQGFSINCVRAFDPSIVNIANGGAGVWPYLGNPNDRNMPEEGATTGLGIGFDCAYSGSGDVIGISVRVDNVVLAQFPLPTLNGSATDPTSLQTGPRSTDNPGSGDLLGWAKCTVSLDANGVLNVDWKGTRLVTNFQTGFTPGVCRWIIAGRTSATHELIHLDNVQLTTQVADKPVVSVLKLLPSGVYAELLDVAGASVKTNTIALKLNGSTITPRLITTSNSLTVVQTDVSPNWLAAGTVKDVQISFTDTANQISSFTRSLTVAPYTVVPESFATAAAKVDTTAPGFTEFISQVAGTELPATVERCFQQLASQILDPETGAPYPNLSANPTNVESSIINYNINVNQGSQLQVGNFQAPDFQDTAIPSIDTSVSGVDNIAMDIVTYLQFPQAGLYTMGVNCDDGFAVYTAASPRDVLGLNLGLFTGGQGASDTVFSFLITKPGFYPFRALWWQSSGDANLEWYMQNPDGYKVPINAASLRGSVNAYARLTVPEPPYAVFVTPTPGATSVGLDSDLRLELADGATPVNTASVQLFLNGKKVAALVTRTNQSTFVVYSPGELFAQGSTNTATILYSDTSTPVNTLSNSWSFIAQASVPVLPVDLASPLGTGDTNQPGFQVKIFQIWPASVDPSQTLGLVNANTWTEQQLLGLFGTNSADLSLTDTNGAFLNSVINWSRDAEGLGAEQGNFVAPEHPDQLIPGMPGIGGGNMTELGFGDIAAEIVTYVEFPAAGYYRMGFNSDDGFRMQASDVAGTNIGAVRIVAPASIAGQYGAISGGSENGGVALALPTNGISAKVVYAQPHRAETELTNTNEVKGNIVLIDRSTNSFTLQLNRAQRAGAVAAIIVNDRDETSNEGALPFVMTGVSMDAPGIPAVMMMQTDGAKLKAHLSEGVTTVLGDDPTPRLAEFNGHRNASDTIFSFLVPQAGVYPFRCTYEQGTGPASCEWFVALKNGEKHLLNDPADPTGLKAYAARSLIPPQPTLSFTRQKTAVVLTFTGRLQSANVVKGPYTDVPNATSPMTNTMTGNKFYRAAAGR
jgi:hypothetical protein